MTTTGAECVRCCFAKWKVNFNRLHTWTFKYGMWKLFLWNYFWNLDKSQINEFEIIVVFSLKLSAKSWRESEEELCFACESKGCSAKCWSGLTEIKWWLESHFKLQNYKQQLSRIKFETITLTLLGIESEQIFKNKLSSNMPSPPPLLLLLLNLFTHLRKADLMLHNGV